LRHTGLPVDSSRQENEVFFVSGLRSSMMMRPAPEKCMRHK